MVKRGRRWVKGFEAAQAASIHAVTTYGPWKMGAALYNGSNLLAVGYNMMSKSHPQSQIKDLGHSFNVFVHAEQMALIRRRHYDGDSNLIMYVWRTAGTGDAACSKPCVNCQELMKLAGVKKVRYFNDQGISEEMKL
jgi:deoxycytidylate deaminase